MERVKMSKQYAPEFCGALADEARSVAVAYLKSNNAPAELVSLIDNLPRVAGAEFDDSIDLEGIVGPMTQNIIALGGEFCGGGSRSGAGDPIPWPGKV
jgi:hypothetical protein